MTLIAWLRRNATAAYTTLIYFAVSALWILGSDGIVTQLFTTPQDILVASIIKGWVYVIIVSIFIFRSVSHAVKQQRAASKIQEISERQLLRAEHMATMGWWSYHVDTEIFEASQEFLDILGLPQVYSRKIFDEMILPEFREMREQHYTDLLEGKTDTYDIYFKVRRLDGKVIDVHSKAEYNKEDRKARIVQGTLQDVTALITQETMLRHALEDRETLLREIHHRVKNNLQIIMSILNLEVDDIRNDQDKIIFEQTQARLRSISLIHEHLYNSPSLSHIDLSLYIQDLARFAIDLYGCSGIQFTFDPANIMVSLDVATPAGLIIMEVITNSIRHGLSRQEGIIDISLSDLHDGRALLIVKDSGSGFPEIITEGLGTKLINALSSQLRASIKRYNDNGAVVEICFPYSTN